MRIYVSSTTMDLADHRRAVIGAILRSAHTPVCMEHHAAGDVVPKDECLREVSICDVYVGVFAWRYGFIPPQCEASITEMEYREAARRGIPVLAFLLDKNVEWPAEFRDVGVDGQRIERLRSDLQLSRWVGFFSSPDNLAKEVLVAISRVVSEKMKVEFDKAQAVTQDDKEVLRAALHSLKEKIAQTNDKRRRKEPDRVPIPPPEKLTRHFQDRDAEMSMLRRCLANKNVRMVLICGRGGVGKTTLAAKLVRELMEDFREGFSSSKDSIESVVYVSLGEEGYRTPDRIVELLSRTLNHEAAAELKYIWNQGGASVRDRVAELFQGPLAQRRCLIVLDNLESVMDDDNRIPQEFAALRQFTEAFLEYDHAALLIATSRRALSLSPDAEIAAIGRRVQIPLDEGLPEGFAIALLRELDCDGLRGIRNATDEKLGNIVRRCQCIPRTLETLVSTLLQRPTWTLDTLLANEPLLSRLIEDPARELSASLSSDQERLVMQVLAVYGKPVPSAAIRFILPALSIDEILDKLVRNFVANHDRGHFWLHPLDRQYAYDQIPEQGSDYSKPTLHSLAAQFYLGIPCPPRESRSCLEDVASMLDALDHFLAADRAEDAAALLLDSGLNADLYWWGYYLLLADLCRRLLDRNVSHKQRVLLHIQLGKVERNLGNLEEALRTYENALPFVREAANRESEIGLLISLGDISYYRGDLDRAFEYHHQAEELLAANPNPMLQSENAGDLANVLWTRKEYQESQRQYERAIVFSQEAGCRIHEGIWNGGLANLYSSLFHSAGDPVHRERAITCFLQAIAIAKETKDRRHECHWNGTLGNFYRTLGEYGLAEAHLREALSISQKIHYRRVIPTQMQWLASVFDERIQRYVQNRDFGAALQAARAFREAAAEIGLAELEVEAGRQLDGVALNEIAFLFQESRMNEAVVKGREFVLSCAESAEKCGALGSISMQWGRRTGHKDAFQLSVEAYTKAISMSPDESLHGCFTGRADGYALLGKIEGAIADYREVISRNPNNIGAALSQAEVQIWAGRYGEARLSLEALHPRLGSVAEKTTFAWLMCHALNLEGRDFSAYQETLEDAAKEEIGLEYNVRDIEPYLRQLDQTRFSEAQVSNTWMIQNLIAKCAGLTPEP